VTSPDPFRRGYLRLIGSIHRYHTSIGGANGTTMVVMFVGLLWWGWRASLYYSYRRNPTGREFFVPARTQIGVFLLIMTTIMLFHYDWSNEKGGSDKQMCLRCGPFRWPWGSGGWCRRHHPTKHVQGYLRGHWTPPSGKYLPRVASADAMVVYFGVKTKLWHCEIAFRSERSKGTKRTLYSAHRSDKLRRKVEHHD
jgi:hypothetical protein